MSTESRTSAEKNDLPSFFRTYYPMFVSFARNYVAEREACEDLVQEAFVSVLEQGISFDNEFLAKGFLYKTIRNKSLNYLRHRQIHLRHAGNEIESYQRSLREKRSEGFLIENIIREESSQIILQALSILPEMGQQVLNMAIEGLSNQEIADVLGISINTVRTHKSRAYKTLRTALSSLRLL